MDHLFESFASLDRSDEVRLLENQSLRSVFVCLLLGMFIFGADALAALYGFSHFHRLNWVLVGNLLVFGVWALRLARLVYRRLGH